MPIFIETLFALLLAFALGLLVAWAIWGENRENQV
jgi:uncharacterized membrane protein YqjE